MSHYANVVPTERNLISIVVQVIVADQDFVETLEGRWIQTSYNSRGNVHYGADGLSDGGVALRANYAGIGDFYDENFSINGVPGVFYRPQPYPSWTLNTNSFLWEAPVQMPDDGKVYVWDETSTSWIEISK